MAKTTTSTSKLSFARAESPAEAAVAIVVEAGCLCPGVYADTHDHGDHYLITLYHPHDDCPFGITTLAVGHAGESTLPGFMN
jgi:hypothetical protein